MDFREVASLAGLSLIAGKHHDVLVNRSLRLTWLECDGSSLVHLMLSDVKVC